MNNQKIPSDLVVTRSFLESIIADAEIQITRKLDKVFEKLTRLQVLSITAEVNRIVQVSIDTMLITIY